MKLNRWVRIYKITPTDRSDSGSLELYKCDIRMSFVDEWVDRHINLLGSEEEEEKHKDRDNIIFHFLPWDWAQDIIKQTAETMRE